MNAYELTLMANSGDKFLMVLSAFHPQTRVSIPIVKAAYEMPLTDIEHNEALSEFLTKNRVNSVGQAADLIARLGRRLPHALGAATAKKFRHYVLKNLYAALPLDGKIAFWSKILSQYPDHEAA